MYLWNYMSSELAENGQPATASIGYYDETNNVVIFTLNDNKWQANLPEGINTREAMILFMVANVPILKDFINADDIPVLFNAAVTEIAPPPAPPMPESVPYAESVPEAEEEAESYYEQATVIQPDAAYYEEEPAVQPESVPYYEEEPVVQPESVPYYEEEPVVQSEVAPYYEQAPVMQSEAAPYYEQAPVMQSEADPYYEQSPVVQPEAAPYYEQAPVVQAEPVYYNEQATVIQPEAAPQQPKEMKIVRCEKCGLFYDAAEYASCPFCVPEVQVPEEINKTVIDSVNNEAETIIELPVAEEPVVNNAAFTPIAAPEQSATVNFYINDGLYASAKAKDGEELSLGRADFCTIACTEEKQLSRVHCTIQYNVSDNTFFVNDKSLNGVFDYTGNRLPKDTTVIVPAGTCLWIATKAMLLELKAPETSPALIPDNEPEDNILITGQPEEQNICPACGGEYTSDSLFCPWCGTKLTV